MNIIAKVFNGRKVKEEHKFEHPGTFQSMYAAQGWLKQNGYSYGSTDSGGVVAVRKGPYDLPQKWRNFDRSDKEMCDGVMTSTDFREGMVVVRIFENKTIL